MMKQEKTGRGFGLLNMALAAGEIVLMKKFARLMDMPHSKALFGLFGAREILNGVNLIKRPRGVDLIGKRVGGDVFNMAALSLALKVGAKRGPVWGGLVFMAAAAALDIWTNRRAQKNRNGLPPS